MICYRYWTLHFFGCVGGFSHAPDELTYGVDVTMMRFCGILQVLSQASQVSSCVYILLTVLKGFMFVSV